MAKFDANELDSRTLAVLKKKGYTIYKKLASGAFGQVNLCIKKRAGVESPAAVKMMDLEKCGEKFKQKFLPRELSVLIQVRHPNVIRIYDIFRMAGKIFIFMEFAPNGTIGDYIKKHDALSEPQARDWFTQAGSALNYCHSRFGIAHRDIKVDNILLDTQNKAKLTDFGFARIAYDSETGRLNLSETFCGTLPYYSPQILEKRPYNPFKSDVWAMGVVLYGMLNNKFPFKFRDLKRMLQTQLHGIYKYREDKEFEISTSAKDLIHRMFEPEESRRPTMEEVMRHAWCVSAGEINILPLEMSNPSITQQQQQQLSLEQQQSRQAPQSASASMEQIQPYARMPADNNNNSHNTNTIQQQQQSVQNNTTTDNNAPPLDRAPDRGGTPAE